MVKAGGFMAKLIIRLIIAVAAIFFIIKQPSYTNDQAHSLINPTEPSFSHKERRIMFITGVFCALFILMMLFH